MSAVDLHISLSLLCFLAGPQRKRLKEASIRWASMHVCGSPAWPCSGLWPLASGLSLSLSSVVPNLEPCGHDTSHPCLCGWPQLWPIRIINRACGDCQSLSLILCCIALKERQKLKEASLRWVSSMHVCGCPAWPCCRVPCSGLWSVFLSLSLSVISGSPS